ncbi:hypothetical protein OG810_35645 [Streptomyces sp. NBC_01693]|uniref:hypothetical protein n=1 Tax=Streptomyces sp. NBC_01693 TaxID=2975912 RepID=UPI002E35EA12|nr:hypothetical protein [Streptomyces sp. NBC_01693]
MIELRLHACALSGSANAPEDRLWGLGKLRLRFSLPRDPGAVALFLRTRALHPDSKVWT